MATCHPPLNELALFATPLNDGERGLLGALLESLDDSWNVFVQPHLLNNQPDFIAVSKEHGVVALEVKDWIADGHRVSGQTLEVRDRIGQWHRDSEDPLAQAHRYRDVVEGVFLTPPGATNQFRSVRGIVVMPRWSTRDANGLLRSTTRLRNSDAEHIGVLGGDRLDPLSLRRALSTNHRITAESHERLMRRLDEPEVITDQRRPLQLSVGARNVRDNPSGATIRRVRGPAGSGKSLGLAARAATLAKEGKTVLLLSFNITLAHYLQGLVRRQCRDLQADHRLVDCVHFHGFCHDLLRGRNPQANGTGADSVIDSAAELYRAGAVGLPVYDAVLVDEGQDFLSEWWNLLRAHVRRTGASEMILAADATQDIYQRRSWTDEKHMLGCGFSGDWTSLRGSYRLPADLVPVVAEFAATYLERGADPPQGRERSFEAASPTIRRWIDGCGLDDKTVAKIAAEKVLEVLQGEPHVAAGDCVFLTNRHDLGLEIANALSREGLQAEHIFGIDESAQRRAKRAFWPGTNIVKGCTVHSYKGWESRAVVAVLDDSVSTNAVELAYVAMSRVRGDPDNRSAVIVIVNCVEDLKAFGTRFTRAVGPDEIPALAGQASLDLESP